MRRLGSAMAVLTLAIGPWLALFASVLGHQSTAVLASSDGFGWTPTQYSAPLHQGTVDTPMGRFHVGGCVCREINVNADNQVTNSTVQSGDAETRNFSLTYVTAGYKQQGNDDVNIDQTANAQSGDAIAGQVLGISDVGGCAHITVHAHNLVANTDVTSGDALADNKSFVFLDPSLRRGDVKVNVDQQATARSGTALAGQIIGVQGGGGPCGGVSIDATNEVSHVNVETGSAKTHNLSAITKCETDGCFREIVLLLHWAKSVQVCVSSGCQDLSVRQFVKALKEERSKGTSLDEQLATPTPTPDPNDDGKIGRRDIFATPRPKKTPAEATPTPVPTPTQDPIDRRVDDPTQPVNGP